MMLFRREKQKKGAQKPGAGVKAGTAGKKGPVAAFILTFFICFAIWIIFSGRFDFFHLVLGAMSCVLVATLSSKLLFAGSRFKDIPGIWLRFMRYLPWLLWQIVLANIHLIKLTFHPRMKELIAPKIIKFDSMLQSEMAHLVFANSITLTPGTITVYVTVYGRYAVHAIDGPSGDALPGEMEKRIAAIFKE